MSFEAQTLPLDRRIKSGQICSTSTCGCDTCPVKALCKGPNQFCDAKFCSTRTRQPVGCLGCRAVCNKHTAKDKILSDLGGAEFNDVQWTPFEADFPDLLFQINSLVYYRYQPFYVINSKKLTYLDTYNWSPQKNLKHRFRIPPKSKTILSFFTQDSWMDNYAINLKKLAREIAKYKPDYVFGPDFSVYDNYPRFDTIINMRRRFLAMKEMQDRGLKVIPCLGWIREEDLDRNINWCLQNKTKYALINFQTVSIPSHNPAWDKELEDLRTIKKALPDTQFFIVGSSAENRLKSIMEVLGKVKLIDAKSFRVAEYHKDIDGKVYPKSVKVLDLFETNVKMLTDRYNKIWSEVNG